MAYSEKVLDHYNHPRNVGSMDKKDPTVGTGMVGAPECGDVMKLQIKVMRRHQCLDCQNTFDSNLQEPTCRSCGGINLNVSDVIVDAKFKTFGCGSAIASSSLATEWLRGKTVEEAGQIKNTDIVNELSLPPVKIHCSVLAEDAIKAAITDYKKKR
ncbi:MAG: Fe-S cluster assembly scaffold IscU [Candidatus Yanofskybacteria bacterium RIFCSPHIGHO2_01_FULL_44_17]|uniref:Fe-S cluster assembly scaffold IscU n=1 Tax=Candidatus Yanofskybacteria bacterium RIFCSPHIGHO2_01_FULL_44_17 TaxID=1802668 RepID=A0A1F8EX75_9BACT|nr:MAG: Fe-S cluster assembly scaffold IscU [Candidatus Yanofskybacteria bacterium RIFCSPHIGHO2_01_FULL_44_17]